MEAMTCPKGLTGEQCNPVVVALDLESLKQARESQWSRLDSLRQEQEAHQRQLDRFEAVLKGAGGNGHPPWGERMVLLEDWQKRQEKLLSALPTQLAEINIQLQMLVSHRTSLLSAKTSALWTAIGSLLVALLIGMGSAALMWWSNHP